METLEDIYIGSVETDRGTREQVRFYDTRGLRDGQEFPRHYFSFADGFVLVYSVDSKESFKRMELLKKEIDRCRDKKEVCCFVKVTRKVKPCMWIYVYQGFSPLCLITGHDCCSG